MYATVKPLSKYLRLKTVRIYDPIFAIHCKCTVVILLTCTFLLSAKQYFGEPIICISTELQTEYVHAYCWTMGIYVLPRENFTQGKSMFSSFVDGYENTDRRHLIHLRELLARNTPYSRDIYIAEGVGPEHRGVTKRLYLRYYQWVFMLLLFQSLLFYLPSFLWKVWEGHRMAQLCNEASDAIILEDTYRTRLRMLTKYFVSDYETIHCWYAIKYVFCEILNVLISILNFCIMDTVFERFWEKYIYALAAIPIHDWHVWNLMSSRVFPKVAKCEIVIYGPSGTPGIIDALCVLPLNILNEKIFAVLYVWFLFIGLLVAFNLIFRLLVICSGDLRLMLFRANLRGMPKQRVREVLNEYGFGGWFVLSNVATNINPTLYRDLIEQIYKIYNEQRHNDGNPIDLNTSIADDDLPRTTEQETTENDSTDTLAFNVLLTNSRNFHAVSNESEV